MISKRAFGFYTLISLVLLLTCKPNGPFLNYLISFGASSLGLIIQTGDIKKNADN